MGNALARLPFYPFNLEQDGTQNQTTLAGKVDMARCPAATSDIVALMTFDHQVRMTNLILRVAQRSDLEKAIDELVDYMLFVEEAPLAGSVTGVSTFATSFAARGPRDRQGRSLRDFALERRLCKYPLSYMVYSEAFDAIPTPIRTRIYRRLYDVLIGKDTAPRFGRLTAADRRAILEIVRDTKRSLPAFWRG